MADESWRIIGQVAVKVVPDTRDFRRDTERKLKDFEAKAGNIKAKVSPQVDEKSTKKTLSKYAEQMSKDLSTQVKINPTLTPGTDSAGWRKSLDGLQEDIQSAAEDGLKFGLKDTWRDDLKVNLDFEANLPALERDLHALAAAFKSDMLKPIYHFPTDVEIDLAFRYNSYLTAKAQLAELARERVAEILPRVSKSAATKAGAALVALTGGRLLVDKLGAFSRLLGNIDRLAPVVGVVAEGVAGLSAVALTGASNVAALSGSLASIGPAALALPGLFGGAAVSATVLGLAMADINRVLGDLGPRFASLQDQVSNNFWAKAEDPMRRMANTLLPELRQGMNETATAMGNLWGNASLSLGREFQGKLGPMFDNLNKGIDIASRNTDAFAGIIEKLGTAGSKYLPDMARWISDNATQFDNWLGAAERSGKLTEWIDTGVEQLGHLGRAAGATGGILYELADAASAAGGSSLETLADGLEGVERVVSSNAFRGGLIDVLTAGREAVGNFSREAGASFKDFAATLEDVVSDVLPTAGRTLGKLGDGLFKALDQPAVANAVRTMFADLETAVEGLLPALDPTAEAMAGLLEVISGFAADVGPVLGDALAHAGEVMQDFVPLLKELSEAFTGGLDIALTAVRPAMSALGGAAKGLATVLDAIPGPIKDGVGALAALATGLYAAKRAMAALAATKIGTAIATGIANANAAVQMHGGVLAAADKKAKGLAATLKGSLKGGLVGLGLVGVGLAIAEVAEGFNLAEESAKTLGDALSGAASDGILDWKNDVAEMTAAADTVKNKLSDLGNISGPLDLLSDTGKKAGLILQHGVEGAQDAVDQMGDQARQVQTYADNMQQSLRIIQEQFSDGTGLKIDFQTGALKKVKADLLSMEDAAKLASAALKDAGWSQQRIHDAMTGKSGAGEFERAIGIMRDYADSMDTIPQRAGAVADSLAKIGDTGRSAAASAEDLENALNNLFDPVLDAEEATDQYVTALKGLDKQLKNTAGFKGYSEAAVANREATREIVRDWKEMAVARTKAGQTAPQTLRSMQRMRQGLIEEARQAGISEAAIRQRLKALKLTPKTVNTIIRQAGIERAQENILRLGDKYRSLPKQLRTDLKQSGYDSSVKNLSNLQKKYKLTPEQVVTVAKATGFLKAGQDADDLRDKLAKVGKAKPNLSSFTNSLLGQLGGAASQALNKGNQIAKNALRAIEKASPSLARLSGGMRTGMANAASTASTGAKNVARNMTTPVTNAKPDMSVFSNAVSTGLAGVASIAHSGGVDVGAQMGSGMSSGVQAAAAQVAEQAAALVNAALAAARAAALIKSPSRKTMEIGGHMATGLAIGIKKGVKGAAKAAAELAGAVLEDMAAVIADDRKTQRMVKRFSRNLVKHLDGAFKGLKNRNWNHAGDIMGKLVDDVSSLWESVYDNWGELPKVTREALQDTIGMTRFWAKAQIKEYNKVDAQYQRSVDKLKGLREAHKDYAASVRDSIISTGNFTEYDTRGFGSLEAGMEKALRRARKFTSAFKELKASGLNKTALDQLAQAGPDALEKAQAILAQGPHGIARINELQEAIKRQGKMLGNQSADSMYQAGLQAAKGLVQGLRKQRGDIVREMKHMVKSMLKTVKQELDIRSPSRVMERLAKQVPAGFARGITGGEDVVKKAVRRMGAAASHEAAGASRYAAAMAGTSASTVTYHNNLYYQAAPGASLGAEEDLFTAANRARMVFP